MIISISTLFLVIFSVDVDRMDENNDDDDGEC